MKDFKTDKFIFGIRPEYLFFRKKTEKTENNFSVRIVNVETIQQMRYGNFYIGENLCKCRVDDGEGISGVEGYVTAESEKILFYDPKSGEIL